jgi:hypothetical protein
MIGVKKETQTADILNQEQKHEAKRNTTYATSTSENRGLRALYNPSPFVNTNLTVAGNVTNRNT